jgi:hypothetical protein
MFASILNPVKFTFVDRAVGAVERLSQVEEAKVTMVARANFFKRFVAVCKDRVDDQTMPRNTVVSVSISGIKYTVCRIKVAAQTINIMYGRDKFANEIVRLIVDPSASIQVKYDDLRIVDATSNLFGSDVVQIANAMEDLVPLAKRFLNENFTRAHATTSLHS